MFSLYLEMIANSLLRKPGFSLSNKDFQTNRYLAASRKIENRICTMRESLLGSSSWKGAFLSELKSRPFYNTCDSARKLSSDECCDACGRTSSKSSEKVFYFISDLASLTDYNCVLLDISRGTFLRLQSCLGLCDEMVRSPSFSECFRCLFLYRI